MPQCHVQHHLLSLAYQKFQSLTIRLSIIWKVTAHHSTQTQEFSLFFFSAKRAKCTYNISGLHNQGSQSIGEESEGLKEKWDPHMHFDSLKLNVEAEDNSEDKTDAPGNWDVDLKLNTEGLQVCIIKQTRVYGDDPHNEDWF